MNINKQSDGKTLTIALEGRLDTTTSPTLEAELKGTGDIQELIFDLHALEYISSAGLRVLLSAQKAMNARGGRMIVRGANEIVMEVFEVTGFIDILTIE